MNTYTQPYLFKIYQVFALKQMIFFVIGFMSVGNIYAQTPVSSHKIEIAEFVFTPQTIDVKPGDSITWTNSDIAPHTATGYDGN